MGFAIEPMPFGDVTNLWARRGTAEPLFVFAGHTDVVPPGPLADWTHPPFEPVVVGNHLFGRGAADMKGSLAAMIEGTRRFVAAVPDHAGSIAFLITSDEEADAINGTVKCMQTLEQRNERMRWCVVGEPSSSKRLGDVIRVGRRGSLNGTLKVAGVQGHVAYPTEANNPIHAAAPALSQFVAKTWDEGDAWFPPTSMQISNIHAGTGATNVIPGTLEVQFNFRFSPAHDETSLRKLTTQLFDTAGLDYQIDWRLSGNPFITREGDLIPAVQQAIRQTLGIDTELSTSGGTSDGRFIAPMGIEVVELGPRNHSIHKVNEYVEVDELDQLADVYEAILQLLLAAPASQ